MKTKTAERIEKYNQRFAEYSEQPIQIVEWQFNGDVVLTTNVNLSGTELRLFRSRSNSKSMEMLRIIGEGYAIVDVVERNAFFKLKLSEAASRTQLNYLANATPDIRAQRRQQALRANSLRKNTRPRLGVAPWNKGLTKDNNEMLQYISTQRAGAGNPMYGSSLTEEQKHIKSKWLKERIADGSWTPHVHNSRTHFESKYNGTAYRSSWEAMFHSLNPWLQYEALRVPYTYSGQQHTYIVDFIDYTSRIIYEVRPAERATDDKTKAKFEAARTWAKRNEYEFILITQQYFIDNFDDINFNLLEIPNISTKLRAIKNASKIKT